MGWMLLVGLVMLATGCAKFRDDRDAGGGYGLLVFFGFWFTVGGILYG